MLNQNDCNKKVYTDFADLLITVVRTYLVDGSKEKTRN
jgi:hypothetical protein